MIETIIIFLIVLAVLIFVHELGHFLFARLFGIRVDEFAIGFGPKLWSRKVSSKKHGDTVYAINAVPFGGYVKIFGENGEVATRSFTQKPRYVQAIVLFAGILFNFLFAWIIVSGAFMGGLPVSAEDYSQYSARFHDERILIVDISPGSPADKAGLAVGDSIEYISGSPLSVAAGVPADTSAPITIDEIQSIVDRSVGKPLYMMYIPAEDISKNPPVLKTVTLTPVEGLPGIASGHYAVGIAMDNAATLSLPPLPALKEGAKYTWSTILATVYGVKDLIAALFQGDRSVLSQVSGPVGIASLVGQAFQSGFSYLILLTAVISINLGVLNFLPFPALDGGRILFVVIEAVIRRPIKPSVANAVNTAGFSLLILLMIAVTLHDIVKIW